MFLQELFNEISLVNNQRLWMSNDDSKTGDRLRFLAEESAEALKSHISHESAPIKICAKNSKIAKALLEKGKLMYAQSNVKMAMTLYNQCLQFSDENQVTAEVFINRSAILADERRYQMALR